MRIKVLRVAGDVRTEAQIDTVNCLSESHIIFKNWQITSLFMTKQRYNDSAYIRYGWDNLGICMLPDG